MKLSNKRLAHRITSTDSFGIFGPNRVTSHAVQFFAHLFSRRDHHSDHGTKVSLRLANNCFYRNVSFRSSFTNASAFLSASKHPTNADYQTSKEITLLLRLYHPGTNRSGGALSRVDLRKPVRSAFSSRATSGGNHPSVVSLHKGRGWVDGLKDKAKGFSKDNTGA